MATRDELIAGLKMTVEQGKRSVALFAEGEWEAERASGWTPKQVYCHLAATAGIVPGMAGGLMAAPEGTDIAQGMDINDMNAKAVGAMEAMSQEQIMAAFEANYGKLIEFVKTVPDEQLNAKRRFFSESIPVSDILANSIMLHGLHHVYEAQARMGAG
jgi:hypothetical protein